MELLSFLADGILLSLQPLNLALIIIGVTVGLFIGAMPGLGAVNGVAILLPSPSSCRQVRPSSFCRRSITARCMAGRFRRSLWAFRALQRP